MSEYASIARSYVLREHGPVVDAVDECADAVTASWSGKSVDSSAAVSEPLSACLRETGVLDALPSVLAGAVAATGHELGAPPVAAPPYVVVTSRGPICRATLPDGRLVLQFRAFEVTEETEYVRGASGDAMLDVAFVAD